MARLSSTRLHTGRVLNLDIDTVRFPDGSTGTLEMIRHPGAAAVLPFLDDSADADPRVLLIRQFRHAAEGFIWEVPAGRRASRGLRPARAARGDRLLRSGVPHADHHLDHARLYGRADPSLFGPRPGAGGARARG